MPGASLMMRFFGSPPRESRSASGPGTEAERPPMTTLTMRVVTGPDIPPMRFKSRPEARDWCKTHYLGSPIKESAPRRAASKIQGVTLSPDDPLAKAHGKK